MNTSKAWDLLSEHFNLKNPDAGSGPAEIVYTLWPVVLTYIQKEFSKPSDERALDFGCGTGTFCEKLFSLGFKPLGIDYAEEMIAVAQKNYGSMAKFLVGDSEIALKDANKDGSFNLIASLMVFMFVENIEQTFSNLSQSLKTGGHIIFAVFNPEHLEKQGRTKDYPIGGNVATVPVFPRTVKTYDEIFSKLNFTKTLETFANTDEGFLEKFPKKPLTTWPKYIVLAYKKN